MRNRWKLLTVLGAIVVSGSCASFEPGTEDDRPPVVVSSGSVVFDPTESDGGKFERRGNNRKWKHKGKANQVSPVRLEVGVTNASCSSSATLKATALTLYVTNGTRSEPLTIYIKGGNLNIDAHKDLDDMMSAGKVVLKDWNMKSLVVTDGADTGTVCGLAQNSEITINQRRQ